MRLIVTFLCVLAISPVWADAGAETERRIRESLAELAPEVKIEQIQPSVIDGLYEVVVGTDVLYMTADGRYALRGDLMDLKQGQNVTQERRSQMRRKLLAGLPKEQMIRFSNGKPEHVIYVFTDTDCAYCRKLHQDVPYLVEHGIEVRYLAYPRAGLDSDTFHEMEAVWCSADRKAALTRAKSGQEIESEDCDNPVAEQYQIGLTMGVRGTPAIYLESGRELPGYMPPDTLLSVIESDS